MPLYEYRCTACGTLNEVLSKVGDSGDTLTCKQCGSTALEKMMSVSTIPSFAGPKQGKTCCGRDERCDSPPCGTSCCSK